MSTKFYAALHYSVNERGYLVYDEETKEVTVSLNEEAEVQKVLDYLHQNHDIPNATGLDTYEVVSVTPLASTESLKLALTRMWDATGVYVDWSRPAEIDGKFYFNESSH